MGYALKELCPKCDKPLEMYYKAWCPRCDKPQRKTIETLNLIQALDHIEAVTGDNKYRNRMWSFFCDYHNFSNDSWFHFGYDLEFVREEYRDGVKLFAETFDIDPDKGIILHVSW